MYAGTRYSTIGWMLSLLAISILHTPGATAQTLTPELLSAFEYRSIGPTRQSGRFVDIAVPRQRPYTFYIATASGHLWKTENNGITFDVLFDNEAVFSIGAIAVAPSNPDILYLGSGEANNSRSSYWGDGVYRSTDAGETWTNVGLPESHHIGRIVIHPANPDIVYVAALGHLYSENEERGLYRTMNGGRSWQKVLGPVVRGKNIGVVDVKMDPSNPDVLYAATFDKVRTPFSYDLGGPGSRVYKTTDGGANWTMLENGLPGGMLGRIGIDIYLRDPRILYLTIENANKPDMSDEDRYEELQNHESSDGMIGGEVYRSNDGGENWQKVNADSLNVGGGPAYYYGQIIIDPNDPDVVHVLSASSWGTRNGGQTWERRPLGFGGDDHTLWIDPDDSNHIILGYDHGMGISYDGGENWYHPDFQSLAQFYAVGYDMSYPYRVAGGLQDNGSHMAPHTNPAGGPLFFEMWERVGGGDGMYNVFETCTNRYLYNESQFGPISRLDLWTGDRKAIRFDDDSLRWNWNAPILISPHDCDVVYHAANKLLRSPFRGESWEVISPDLTKADPATLTTGKGGDGNIQYATITTIDESTLVPGLLWVGTDDGNVQVSRDGGENWTLVSTNISNNPNYWVSRVEASHHQPGTAYVSYTGYRNDDFRPFVYKTTDYGQTWTSIAANLPPGPINVVREHHSNPNLLFVATEFQVFASIDGGTTWTSMKNSMPTQPVHDMQIHPRENDLIVATHGRGIYIADISPLARMTPEVLASDVHFFQPESKTRWIADDRTNYSSSNFEGESEPDAILLYYNLRNGAADSITFTIYQGDFQIAEVKGTGTAGLHSAEWDMSKRIERSPEEIRRIMAERGGRGGRGGGGGRGG
ncbi:MAG: WD40/YVTN/BNR-like repeat-containing protein, partial [Longimicrobiales bacterium]